MGKTWVQVLAWVGHAEGLALLTHWIVLRQEDVSPGQRLKLVTLLVSSLIRLSAMLRLLPHLLGSIQIVVKQDPGHTDLVALVSDRHPSPLPQVPSVSTITLKI